MKILKTFLISIGLLIALVLFGYWFIFYKGEPLKDANMISVCITNNKLKVGTTESAKVFTSCKSEVAGDTLKVFIETALVNLIVKAEHPRVSGEFELNPQIKYISIAGKTTPVSSILSCGK